MSLMMRRRMMMLVNRDKEQEIGVNLFTDWVDGKWLTGDGKEEAHDGTSVTPFIEVYSDFTYSAEVPVINYGAFRTIFFYDSDKNYISFFSYNLFLSKVQEVTIPEGAKYARTSQYTNQKEFMLFYRTS